MPPTQRKPRKGTVSFHVNGGNGKLDLPYEAIYYLLPVDNRRKQPLLKVRIKAGSGAWKEFKPKWRLNNLPSEEWQLRFIRENIGKALPKGSFGISLS